jgi:Uma2 family endonuclease
VNECFVTTLLIKEEMPAPTRLRLPELSDDEFFAFAHENEEYRIERTAAGVIVLMPGTGGRTGNRNSALNAQLYVWAVRDGRGIAFDSSTMFKLPNTAMRSPDASWVARERLQPLPDAQKDKWIPLCPEFVVELTSPSDSLREVKEKMQEWMANGCHLGWMLHPPKREAHIFRSSGVEIQHDAAELRGEGPVAGFVLDLSPIWQPGW